MTNIYGETLDRNGYSDSIMEYGSGCFVCGAGGDLARHEIYYGTAYRQRSKELGLWVRVCPACHAQIHANRDLDHEVKKLGQMKAMLHYRWTVDDFRQRFGKNWL